MAGRGGKTGEPKQSPARVEDGELFVFKTDALSPIASVAPLEITKPLAKALLAMTHEPREQFRVLFLDVKNQLITDEVMNYGTIDHAPVYPREIAPRAPELSAAAVILVHNHPSGDPKPSAADIAITRGIVDATASISAKAHDHLVIGRERVESFRSLGLL